MLAGGVASAVSGGSTSGLADIDPLKSGVLNVGGAAKLRIFKVESIFLMPAVHIPYDLRYSQTCVKQSAKLSTKKWLLKAGGRLRQVAA